MYNNITITLTSIKQLECMEKYDYICGYHVGNSRFSLRPSGNFDIEDIEKLRNKTNRKIFVNVNKLFHNEELKDLEIYLDKLEKIKVDYVVFGDLAVYEIMKMNNYSFKLMYSTETTITNRYFTDFAKDLSIAAIDLAKEITLAEIKEISEHKNSEIAINIHGHIYMYQSKRKLISNYNEKYNVELSDSLLMYDEERDKYYPLIENEQGTHILASHDVSMLNHLDKIVDLPIDFLKIDTYGYFVSDVNVLLDLYDRAFKSICEGNYKVIKKELNLELIQKINYKKYNTGFFFKKTVY